MCKICGDEGDCCCIVCGGVDGSKVGVRLSLIRSEGVTAGVGKGI